jgi:hypothetical protein
MNDPIEVVDVDYGWMIDGGGVGMGSQWEMAHCTIFVDCWALLVT